MKQYFKAPLPLQGQKRNFFKQTMQILRIAHMEGKINEKTIFLDVFGGSGLLSHNIKQHFKKNRVVYNDFDNYSERLKNIATTEKLRLALLKILGPKHFKTQSPPKEKKEKILEHIKTLEKNNSFIDWLTIYSWLSFSAHYSKDGKHLRQSPIYPEVTRNPLSAEGYLEGVEIISKDFREVFRDFEFENNVIYILDPPYLQTQTEAAYKEKWNLKNFLDLVDLIKPPYLFYSSESSEVIEFFKYASRINPHLKGYELAKAQLSISHSSKNDLLLYKL